MLELKSLINTPPVVLSCISEKMTRDIECYFFTYDVQKVNRFKSFWEYTPWLTVLILVHEPGCITQKRLNMILRRLHWNLVYRAKFITTTLHTLYWRSWYYLIPSINCTLFSISVSWFSIQNIIKCLNKSIKCL